MYACSRIGSNHNFFHHFNRRCLSAKETSWSKLFQARVHRKSGLATQLENWAAAQKTWSVTLPKFPRRPTDLRADSQTVGEHDTQINASAYTNALSAYICKCRSVRKNWVAWIKSGAKLRYPLRGARLILSTFVRRRLFGWRRYAAVRRPARICHSLVFVLTVTALGN